MYKYCKLAMLCYSDRFAARTGYALQSKYQAVNKDRQQPHKMVTTNLGQWNRNLMSYYSNIHIHFHSHHNNPDQTPTPQKKVTKIQKQKIKQDINKKCKMRDLRFYPAEVATNCNVNFWVRIRPPFYIFSFVTIIQWTWRRKYIVTLEVRTSRKYFIIYLAYFRIF